MKDSFQTAAIYNSHTVYIQLALLALAPIWPSTSKADKAGAAMLNAPRWPNVQDDPA